LQRILDIAMINRTDQNKTKQNKTKQNKTKQNKTKQNKTNKTKQNKTKQNKTKQNKTKQNKTKQNKTKQNKTNLSIKLSLDAITKYLCSLLFRTALCFTASYCPAVPLCCVHAGTCHRVSFSPSSHCPYFCSTTRIFFRTS
jgi:thiol:disulfide interchange protein